MNLRGWRHFRVGESEPVGPLVIFRVASEPVRPNEGGPLTIEQLTAELRSFAEARNWPKYHTTKNLAMALTGEVGELVAELQWLTPEEADPAALDAERREAIRLEIADVFIYLLRLSDVLGVDPIQAAQDKLKINADRDWPEK